jgi:PAS domain S-box-containing protein
MPPQTRTIHSARSEEFYEKVYQQVVTGIAITDWNGVFEECNPAYCALLGYTEEELQAIDFASLVHPDDREFNLTQVRRLQAGEISFFDIENRYVRKDGQTVWVHKFVSVLRGPNGQPAHFIALVTNITERKRAEQGRRESEERWRLAAQAGKMFAYSWDAATDVIERSGESAQILGIEEDSGVTGASALAMVHPADAQRLKAAMANLTVETPFLQVTYRIIRPDGAIIWVNRNSRAYFDGQGKLARVIGMVMDVTEHKRAEEAIKESELRFRLLADTAPVMIWMSGTDQRATYFNRLWLDFTGLPESDLRDGLQGIVHPDDYAKCHDTYCRGFEQRRPFNKECRLRRHDGEYRWMLDIAVPRFQEDGSFAGYIGSCVDITEQKLAEEALSSISGRMIEAHEQERALIARELHDDIGQRLALVAVQLDRERQDSQNSREGLLLAMEEAIKRISDLAGDIHSMSHRLHSSKLDTLGLAAAAGGFCREVSQGQNVVVDFQSEGIPEALSEDVALCLFRVLQEALQNATKHSGSKRFWVSLVGSSNQIVLTVRDEGRGFQPDEALQKSGLGMTSMMERLKLVGGELRIDGDPQPGTILRACVPFGPNATSLSATV